MKNLNLSVFSLHTCIKNSLLVAGSVLGIMVSAVPQSQAASIGVNFSGGVNVLAPTDSPGIVPGSNWNNISGASGNNISLLDDSGTTTTALLTFNSGGVFNGFAPTSTSNPATNTLYGSGLFGSNVIREVSITLDQIPFAVYDLYVFASADTSATNTLSITDGTTTYYYASNGQRNSTATNLLKTTSTTSGSPTFGPGQYQLFSGLTSSSITLLTAGSVSNVLSNNVFGLQIVGTASQSVPEPSIMIALVLFGSSAVATKILKS